jgi:hypothetical protein
MECRSISYDKFAKETVDLSRQPLKAILETIRTGIFPGSQLYLYYKMNHTASASIDSSEFITDTAFIYKYRMQREENTEKLLAKHFHDSLHIENVYTIIRKAWEILKDSEASIHHYL